MGNDPLLTTRIALGYQLSHSMPPSSLSSCVVVVEGPYSPPTYVEGVESKVYYCVGEENSLVGMED